jgi:hypothetical protein
LRPEGGICGGEREAPEWFKSCSRIHFFITRLKSPFKRDHATKLKRAVWRNRYRLRKKIAEAVFVRIKQARGFRQFLLRDVEKVSAERTMVCTTHKAY